MIEIFRQSPWLLIVLGALCVPIFGIILGGWASFLEYRQRKAALDALQAYAAQGKEAPPELLRAVGGGRWRGRDWGEYAGPEGPGDVRGEIQGAAREAREEMRAGMRRWRRNEPLRTWRRAVTWSALAGGFFFASRMAETSDTQHGFLIAAILLGAVAAATILSAILATLFREK